MKVLVGICGIGNGHLSRQTSVINLLLKKGYKVVIASTNNNINYFYNTFKNVDVIEISIPWITCNEKGIDFFDTLKKYKESQVNLFEKFLEFSINVEKCFNGIPNIVITDYEPNVAQYSYAVHIPLICMEQQSKFLYLDNTKIENYSILEEKYRLNYFFPNVDYRLISSFFYLNIKDDNVRIMPPVIKDVHRVKPIINKGLVYLSPYCNNKEKFFKILDLIAKLNKFKFIIYTNLEFDEYKLFSHMQFKKFGKEFEKDFSDSYFLISSSGHQLISEAISGEIPMYLFPLNTYEQNYNCLMVQQKGFGEKICDANLEEFEKFYNSIPNFINNMQSYKKKYWNKSWEKILGEIIEGFEK